MTLFEIYTGRTGESYQRCYAWAESKEEALKLFQDRHPDSRAADMKPCFSSDCDPFVSELSDSGFESQVKLFLTGQLFERTVKHAHNLSDL